MTARDVIGRAIHGQVLADGGYILVDSILEDLAEAGYAVVKLPDMERDEWGDKRWAVDVPKDWRARIQMDSDGRIMPTGMTIPFQSADVARAFAVAILAAARHDEDGDQ